MRALVKHSTQSALNKNDCNSESESDLKTELDCSQREKRHRDEKNCKLQSYQTLEIKFQDKAFIVFESRDYFFQLMLKLADYFVYIMFESKD